MIQLMIGVVRGGLVNEILDESAVSVISHDHGECQLGRFCWDR